MAIADVKTLRQCLKVAELGSLSRAAEALNIAQPWLSTRIRKYEEELGFAIFDRSRRKIALTAQGEALIEAARQFLGAADRLTAAVRQQAARAQAVELHLGCPSASSGVEERNRLFAAFRERNPHVTLRIHLLSSGQIVDGLESGRLDIAFLLDPLPPAVAGKEAIAIRRQRAVIFMPCGWMAKGAAHLVPAHLAGRTIAVMPEAYHPELTTPIYAELRKAGATLVEMADDSFLALHDFALKQKIGALTVDTFADSLMHFPDYGTFLLQGEPFSSNLQLIKPRDDATKEALDFWAFAGAQG